MAHSGALVDVLKRELRAKGVTYAQVARKLGLSEASVKRMFSRREFTLKRLDQVCELTQSDLTELAHALHREEALVSQLTPEQEREIATQLKLFLVAVCVLNHVSPAQIVATYDLSEAECVQMLVRLDRIGFIRLLPGNRIRLLISRDFSWLPDGPIQRFFKQQGYGDYVNSRFDRPDEYFVAVNGMLSERSRAAMVARLKRVAREFSELHNEDVRLSAGQRRNVTMLVAIRNWELQAFSRLRRGKPPYQTAGVK